MVVISLCETETPSILVRDSFPSYSTSHTTRQSKLSSLHSGQLDIISSLPAFKCRTVIRECRKTKTKVITLANHKRHRQSNEPIKTRGKYVQLTKSAGKRERVNHDRFCFHTLAKERTEPIFQKTDWTSLCNKLFMIMALKTLLRNINECDSFSVNVCAKHSFI